MKHWTLRTLAVALVAIITSLGLVAPASATPQSTLKAAAKVVAYERVYGSKYGYYKDKYPTELNWTNNGCSIPKEVKDIRGIGKIIEKLGDMWQKSCDRHDFGYRNFGSNTTTPGVHPKFSPTKATKAKIDKRFRSNMKIQCDKNLTGIEVVLRPLCHKAADAFYLAVKVKGGKAFFG